MSDGVARGALLAGALPVAWRDAGEGRPALLLHGGAGPASMASLAAGLAERGRRAITPIYPGFDGEPRPDWLHRIGDLATMLLALVERLDLSAVSLIGNSVGGWLALETALRGSPRIADVVILDAVGLDPTPDGGGIVDPASLPMSELLAYSFHDPSRALPPSDARAAAAMAANQRALRIYAGEPFMNDPTLRSRLPGLAVPMTVVWGASDRIVTPAYGRQFADLVPKAIFIQVEDAGHFPQLERTEAVLEITAA